MFLNKIIDLLAAETSSDDSADNNRERLIQLSTAALLIEISLADSAIGQQEQELMLSMVEEEFALSREEADALLTEAKSRVENSVSLFEFTNQLKDELSREERKHIVKLLWKVAYADAVLDKYEEYFVRKIADLLYVSQTDYIQAKLAAQESLQQTLNQ